jgi:hypothetical protein
MQKFPLPYERLTFRTHLSEDEILQKLNKVIEPMPIFRWPGSKHKPYEGIIYGYRFSAVRVAYMKDAFIPYIKGEISPETEGCSIHVTMEPHRLTLVFIALYCVLFGCTSLGWFLFGIVSTLAAGAIDLSVVSSVLPAIFLILGYLFFTSAFKRQSVKARAFFRKLFQAYQIDEQRVIGSGNAA